MLDEDQYSAQKLGQKWRREGGYSRASDREELGSVDQEIDRLFRKFGLVDSQEYGDHMQQKKLK